LDLLFAELPFDWEDILRVPKMNWYGSQNLPSPLFAKEGYFPPFGKGRKGGIL
jgi:hypothetical protein